MLRSAGYTVGDSPQKPDCAARTLRDPDAAVGYPPVIILTPSLPLQSHEASKNLNRSDNMTFKQRHVRTQSPKKIHSFPEQLFADQLPSASYSTDDVKLMSRESHFEGAQRPASWLQNGAVK